MSQIDYADPDIQIGGDWVKWTTVNDSVVGTITSYSKKKRDKDDGSTVINPVYSLTKDDGTETNIEVGQVGLKAEFLKVQPQIGDKIRIVYVSEERIPGKASKMKVFTLEKSTPATPPSQLAAATSVLESQLGAVAVTPSGVPF